MPTILFYGPDLDNAKKNELIRDFTETGSRLTGIDKSAFTIFFSATSPDNVGVGGELLRYRMARRKP